MPNKHLIVYAEDDLDDLMFVREAFEQHDHIEILHAPHGKAALDLLQQLDAEGDQPCLVILDINMPLLDGRKTLELIRRNPSWEHIPVVLFSTSSASHDQRFAQLWGSELITKPLRNADLAHIARTFVDKCNFEKNKTGLRSK